MAKQLLNQGKKRQALVTMKKRKYQQQLLERTDKQLQNLNDMVCLLVGPFLLCSAQ